MTTPQASLFERVRPYLGWFFLVAVLVAALVPNWRMLSGGVAHYSFTPHAPDWALAQALPLTIKLHIAAALAALGIGTVVLVQPKGSGLHKTLGWAWVIAMAATAISSLFIVELNQGSWSFIHLLSGWTLVALPMGIYAIRRRQVKSHKRAMTGMFLGGLIVAGLLTFIPGRFFYNFFFS